MVDTPVASPSQTPNTSTPSPSQISQPLVRVDFPPNFSGDGKEDFSQWCRRFEVAANAWPGGDSLNLANLLPSRLEGSAFIVWDSLSPSEKADFSACKKHLATVFGKKSEIATFQRVLNARPRRPQEPLEVYVADLTRLTTMAFPHFDKTSRDDEVFRRFLVGLHPELQRKCHEHGATSLENAIRIAHQIERADEAMPFPSPYSQSNPPIVAAAAPQPDPMHAVVQSLAQLHLQVSDLAGTVQRLTQRDSRRYDAAQRRSPSPYSRAQSPRSQSPFSYPSRHDGRYSQRPRSPSPYRRRDSYSRDSRYSRYDQQDSRAYSPARSSTPRSPSRSYDSPSHTHASHSRSQDYRPHSSPRRVSFAESVRDQERTPHTQTNHQSGNPQ